jgi:hypothetical protein
MLTAEHATVEYVMPLVINNYTITEEWCFLCWSMKRSYKQNELAVAVREVLVFSRYELLLLGVGN